MYCVPNLGILQWNILLKARNQKRMRNSRKKSSVKHKCPPLIRSVFLEKVQDALRYLKKGSLIVFLHEMVLLYFVINRPGVARAVL